MSRCATLIHMPSTADIKVVQNYLQVLGIEPAATRAYLALLKLGPSSVLQIAKHTVTSRTQMYRHLEQLQQHGLVSMEQLSYGSLYRALPLENIEATIASREAETAAAKQNLGVMADMLQALAGSAGPKATVQHYYGMGGLKQINWNITKASQDYRVFEAAHLSQHFDKEGLAFARRCRERYVERGLTSYDLTNDTEVKAKDLEPFEPSRTFLRHIDSEILRINFEINIYDDVVSMVDYGASSLEQLLATEIHHPTLSAMMRQLFDAMWNIGTPLEIR